MILRGGYDCWEWSQLHPAQRTAWNSVGELVTESAGELGNQVAKLKSKLEDCETKLFRAEQALKNADARIDSLTKARTTRQTCIPGKVRSIHFPIAADDIFSQHCDPDYPRTMLAEDAEQRFQLQVSIDSAGENEPPQRIGREGRPQRSFKQARRLAGTAGE